MDLKNKNILVFTGGGVAPALNATLTGVILKAKELGACIFGGIDGWACLAKDEGKIFDLSNLNVDWEKFKNTGGTFLKTSRTNPFREKNGINQLQKKIKEHRIDFIVAIGGDDTLGAAFRLFSELGIPIIGVPKTIDNDLSSTWWTPGFPTAAFHLAKFCAAIKRTAHATKKIYIIESLGGKTGWLPAAGILGKADLIIPPERKINLSYLSSAIEKTYDEENNVVLILSHTANLGEKVRSEYSGQKDQYGIKRSYLISLGLRRIIEEKLKKVEVKILFPGNYLSAASPIALDCDFAFQLGKMAIELIQNEKFGEMARIEKTASGFSISSISLSQAIGKYRNLEDENLFDFYNFKPAEEYARYISEILDTNEFFNQDYYSFLKKFK